MNTPIDKSIFNETGCVRKEQLLHYRDHQLSGREQHEVEEHLVDCVLCSEALEGLAFVSSAATLDSLQDEISKMVLPAPAHSFRPWLAAATITGVVLFSLFTYMQFKNVSDERLAVNETVVPVKDVPAASAETGTALSESETTLNAVPQEKVLKNEIVLNEQEESVSESISGASVNDEVFSDASMSEPSYAPEVASVAKMEIPAVASKDIATVSTALKNTGNQNITYVDNVKVIDYDNYDTGKIKQADVPRSTASKYQNNKKQAEAAEAEKKSIDLVSRKADYLDLVADPVILFNNGRYESANAGFDKLLKLNNNDQNAAFYKGLSLYNMKQFDPALELLVPISNDSASPFMEEAQFYAAQSFISNGAVPKGKIMLEEISNNNGFYSKKAAEVLRQIK